MAGGWSHLPRYILAEGGYQWFSGSYIYIERERDKGGVIYSGFKVKVNKTPSQPMTAWFKLMIELI